MYIFQVLGEFGHILSEGEVTQILSRLVDLCVDQTPVTQVWILNTFKKLFSKLSNPAQFVERLSRVVTRENTEVRQVYICYSTFCFLFLFHIKRRIIYAQ